MFVFTNIFFKFLIFYPHFPTFYQQNTPNQTKGKPKGRFFWFVVDKSRCRCFVI